MVDWAAWQAHVNQVVEDRGQWIGLCDGWGRPLMDMPQVVEMTAPQTRHAVGSLSLTVGTTGGEYAPVHPVVDAMVAEGLGTFDEEGALVVKDGIVDMIVVARRGLRRAYVTSFPTVSGGVSAPSQMVVQGTDLLDRLVGWPCPSVPQTWIPSWDTWTEDAGVEYKAPRDLAAVEFAAVVDGYTMDGPAEATVRALVQDSLDAVNHACMWEGSEHLVVDMRPSGVASERATIRVQDGLVWETIAPVVQAHGLNVSVDLWWPGDEPVLARPSRGVEPVLTSWPRPIGVVRINQIEGA